MAKKMRFELNRAGVAELMKSGEMVDVLTSYADSIADAAGDGFDTYIGRNRANVSVRTATDAAAEKNLKDNTLLKAAGDSGLTVK